MLSCEDYAQLDVARRYVAGGLGPAEVEAFEDHFLTCTRCREAVAFADAVHDAGRAAPTSATSRPARSTRWLTAAGVAVAAGLALVALVHVQAAHVVRALGMIDRPPEYRGVQLRAEVTAADSLFDGGMTAYTTGRYEDAVRLLRGSIAARSAAPDSGATVPAHFFLGASLLIRREPALAADAFGRVIAAGWSPYRDEAHYYRALALLQAGNAGTAAAELRVVAAGASPIAARARVLLARLPRR